MPVPLTSSYGIEAHEQVRCAQLVVDEFNDSGGLNGRAAELVVRDTKHDADLTRRMTVDLLEKEKVDFVAGALSGADMVTIAKLCTEQKVVYNGLSIGDSVVSIENRSKYVFH